MSQLVALFVTSLLLLPVAITASGDGPTPTDDAAAALLAELDGLEAPRYDPARRGEDDDVERFLAERRAHEQRRVELIGELARIAPEHQRLSELLPERWRLMMRAEDELSALLDELGAWMERRPGSELALEACYQKGLAARALGDPLLLGEVIDTLRAAAPDDTRGARLLNGLARMHATGSAEQRAAYQRLIDDYAESRDAAFARGKLRQLDGIGQPFELAFDDAVSGTRVDLAAWRGRVVVIDFWATWCGPCVAEMPAMKALHAEYHERGVEFVGVSLDNPEERGGLRALREYVAEHEVPWPQYYQGAGWDGAFSVSWGINSIPALFVVDQDGLLANTSARGKLDQILPALLAGEG